ncbi:hypothetical protein [Mesorhizobium captivum]|uniref:Uncharacterized protein n=1 Tax=Mesorhizobium captivum TaxID=3072319 RepID=A0ABU4Z3Q6_9HYPH|nr:MULTISPECIES: hypothetical protein [unclassified Mesorhizobium]MDX8446626.1 hypothetical protein [Mesorhizobium sp. VK3C]MDX8493879.1 hypothetical protein [Mesorhizobium sp. VK22B]MDX8507184.1 hypothetical protein [Mesorhizobium sp. VK22E]
MAQKNPSLGRWNGMNAAHGIQPLAAVYAKQGSERQDIVRFLPGFRPKDEGGDSPVRVTVFLDRLK